MKNKANKDMRYSRMKRTVLFKITLIVFCSLVCLLAIYSLVKGHFSNWIVNFLTATFDISYEDALTIYRYVFRNNAEIIMFTAVGVIFLVIFRFTMSWITKYFDEVDNGLSSLMSDEKSTIGFSPEIKFLDDKITALKQALDRKKLEAMLSEQRKNDLVVYLAHDLKTPLTSVIGYLTLLHDELQISPELREKYLAISLNKAERLEDLINEFFEITRFSLSHITLEFSKVNLTRMLEQLISEFQPMLDEKGLQCLLSAAPDISLRCDIDKLQRVLDNLLRNAVNYSFNDTAIAITVTPSAEDITLRFVNHGNTIPKDKLERIFEQFFRLDTARTTKSGGVGLGLAIAKEIVELHNGTLTAFSEADMVIFEIAIPQK